MTWTLQTPADTKSLANWGVTTANLHRESLGVDTLTLQGHCAFDAAPFVAVDDEVVLYRDGARYFAGRVDRVTRSADPASEAIQVTIVGPWWYLANLVYQQQWNIGETANARYQSHVILYVTRAGIKQTTADQVQNVIDYAVASVGAKLQLAAGSPAINAPNEEAQDLTCAEVIHRACRWAPDSVGWFDYATTPPTLHIARRADLTPVTIDLAAGSLVSGLSIQSREDLQISAIEIIYKRADTINGRTYLLDYRDTMPAAAINPTTGELLPAYRLGAMTATIQLEGSVQSYASAAVVVQDIAANHATEATRLAWWRSKLPVLDVAKDARITNLSVPAATVVRGGLLPREVVSGQIASWMNVSAAQELITAVVSYDVYSGSTLLESVKDKKVSVRITATDATTRTYTQLTTSIQGEAVPTGIAASLYAALSELQYDGQLMLTEPECSSQVGMGNAINLANGRTEWATMQAAIYATEESLLDGTTTISWQPNPSLGPQDLVELLRVNRTRRIYTNPAVMQSGISTGGGDVPLGSNMALENSIPGSERTYMKRFGSLDEDRKQVMVGDEGTGIAKVQVGNNVNVCTLIRYDQVHVVNGVANYTSNYGAATVLPGEISLGGWDQDRQGSWLINIGPNRNHLNRPLTVRPVKIRTGTGGAPDTYVLALASDEFTV